MMSTNLGKEPYNVFPMGTQKVDQNGDLWFFSNRNSDHFDDIQSDSRVQITYSNGVEQEYLSIIGDAVPMVDSNKMDELWSPLLTSWFKGKKDPDLVLLNVKIEEAKWWDSKTNRMIPLISMPQMTA